MLEKVISRSHRSGRAAVTIILAISKGAVKHGAPLLPFVRIKKLRQHFHEGNRLDDGKVAEFKGHTRNRQHGSRIAYQRLGKASCNICQ